MRIQIKIRNIFVILITAHPWNKVDGLYISECQQKKMLCLSLKDNLAQTRLRANADLTRWIKWPPTRRSRSTGLFLFPTVECADRLRVFRKIFEGHRHQFSNITLPAKMTLNFKILNLTAKNLYNN